MLIPSAPSMMTNKTPSMTFLLVALVSCSTDGGTADGGVDAPVDAPVADAPADSPADAAGDGGLSAPEALDQAGKLALWLEATSSQITLGDAGGVTAWKDKSKNKNDAVAGGPLAIVASGAVAGHDAVHFNIASASVQIADAVSLQFGTGQVYIVAVTRVRVPRMFWFQKFARNDGGTVATGIEFFDANAGANDAGGFIFSPFGELDNQSGNSVNWGTTELNDDKFHIVAFRRTASTSIEVAVDDLAPRTQTVAAVDVSATGELTYLGSPPQSPGPGTPDLYIAEELVVHDASGLVSDKDAAAVHAYLKQKYAL